MILIQFYCHCYYDAIFDNGIFLFSHYFGIRCIVIDINVITLGNLHGEFRPFCTRRNRDISRYIYIYIGQSYNHPTPDLYTGHKLEVICIVKVIVQSFADADDIQRALKLVTGEHVHILVTAVLQVRLHLDVRSREDCFLVPHLPVSPLTIDLCSNNKKTRNSNDHLNINLYMCSFFIFYSIFFFISFISDADNIPV